jgi:hypothetical protein
LDHDKITVRLVKRAGQEKRLIAWAVELTFGVLVRRSKGKRSPGLRLSAPIELFPW